MITLKTEKRLHFWRYAIPVMFCLLVACFAMMPQTNAADYTATINVNTTYQTLEGFGAATAWYASWLTQHPNKAEIYDLLFNGLGLDIIRFRNTYGSRNGASFAPDEPEIVQKAAQSLGHSIKVLISSWTPPSDLKANSTLNGGTLAKVNGAFNYSGFADYWYNSINAYIAKGITPDYISIQNEPDYENSGWETCIFKPTEDSSYPGYGKALDAVYTKLQTMTTTPKILGPETAGIGSSLVQTYANNMNLSQIYGIAHHLYNGGDSGTPDSFITNMQSLSSTFSSYPLFQTEYDQGTAFATGQLILNSLIYENASSYFYWDLIWTKDQRPLVALEDPNSTSSWTTTKGYIISDFYYVFKHFSKFTDPGYKRVYAATGDSNIQTVAFTSADQKRLTIVLINNNSTQSSVALNLNGFGVGTSAIYRTIPGGSEKFSDVGALGTDKTVTLPAKSIATVVIDNSTITSTPAFSPAAGTYSSAQSVTISSATSGAKIYYTTDGTTPTSSSTLYSAPITVSSTTTIKAIAMASGYTDSDVASATYKIGTQAATPTFSPAAGTYSSAQNVTISSTTSEAKIYYTIDGSTPTSSSTVYSGAITVSKSATIKAIAVASGMLDSEVASATYTITSSNVVTYTIVNDWGNGATVNVTIKNNGLTAINGWTLAWTFPGSQVISNLWNGSYTQSGTMVSVTNLSYNETIAAGGTVNFGFNLNYSGANTKPTSFTLNGASCQIQ